MYPIDLSIKSVISKSFSELRQYFHLYIPLILLYLTLASILKITQYASMLFLIIESIVWILISIGFYYIACRIQTSNFHTWKQFFIPFTGKTLRRIMVVYLFYLVIITTIIVCSLAALLALSFMYAQGPTILMENKIDSFPLIKVFFVLCTFIPIFILISKYILSTFIILEEDLPASKALSESYRRTRNYNFKIACILFLFYVIPVVLFRLLEQLIVLTPALYIFSTAFFTVLDICITLVASLSLAQIYYQLSTQDNVLETSLYLS